MYERKYSSQLSQLHKTFKLPIIFVCITENEIYIKQTDNRFRLLTRNSPTALMNCKTYLCTQGLLFKINCKQINDLNVIAMNTSFVYPCHFNLVYIRVNILLSARISSLVENHYVNIMWVQTIIQHKLKTKKEFIQYCI